MPRTNFELTEHERENRLEIALAIKSRGRHKHTVPIIDAMRDVVANGYKRIRGYAVDSYSASAFVAVYDAVNEQNKEKLVEIAESDLPKAIGICFKLMR